MATPYDLYVRFLVTKGAEDVESVNSNLAELNLPPIPDQAFDLQYAVVHDHVPAGIAAQITKKTYSVDFLKWMEILQVAELWQGEKTAFTGKDQELRGRIKLVYDVHQDPGLRMTINALLIKAVPARDLTQAINSKYASLLREVHIVVYEKFFFNPRQMTRAAWKNFIRAVQELNKREAAAYFVALSSPLDEVKTDLELPAKVSSSDSLQFIATKAFQKVKSALDTKTPEGDVAAQRWITTYLNVVDKYEKHRTGDQADFGNALQMEFEFINDEFLTPDPDVLKEITDKQRREDDNGKEKESAGPEPAG